MVTRFHINTALGLLAVLVIADLAYWPGLNGPFVLDDEQNIASTYIGHIGEVQWDALVYALTHNTSGVFGRPVSVLSFVASGLLHGPGTWGYKYHNLLLHLLNGLLLFWLLLRLLPHLMAGLPHEKQVLGAGLTATCWLFHPLLVSTVLYSVQRMAQLSMLFTLLALLSYVLGRERMDRRGKGYYLLSYGCFPLFLLLALLAKENGALIPLYVLAIEWLAFRFSARERHGKWRLGSFLTFFVAVPLVVGGYYFLTHLAQFLNYDFRTFTLSERLLTELHVVFFYTRLILLPRLSELSLFHDDIAVVSHLDLSTLLLLALLIAVIALIWLLRQKAPVLAFGLAWFLISHLMESTVISLELVFEHRNYIATVGLLLPVVHHVLNYQGSRLILYLPGLYLVLLLTLTVIRVQEWQDLTLFYTMAEKDHPGSYRAQTEYANLKFNQGDPEEAFAHLQMAQQINPRDAGSVLHEMLFRCHLGTSLDALVADAEDKLATNAVSPYTLVSLERMVNMQNKGECRAIANEQVLGLIQTASRQQDNVRNKEFLGYLQRLEGIFHLLHGEYAEGAGLMIRAYENSQMFSILVELVNIQLGLDRLEEAEHMIAQLDKINAYVWGIETSKIAELKTRLEQKMSAQASAADAAGE
ncbi:MAG: hypothetical protein RQ899_01095 [Pseudomonadales bacterium]|nr:hypothetical protein [Pseudomonadales bacterium]